MPASSIAAHLATRQLGNSDIHITRIGFGAWAIGGGDWQFAWGHQEGADSVAAIERALDLGLNWIDTAAIYGLGHSEEVVARALKQTVTAQTLCLHQIFHAVGPRSQDLPEPEGSLRA
jgi:aryl-alcohol dehydrogenase-like predicted oxidoreductase